MMFGIGGFRIGSNNSLRLGQRKETASRIKRKAAEWKMNVLDPQPSRKSSSIVLDIKGILKCRIFIQFIHLYAEPEQQPKTI